jgi:hypothetical protein
MIPEIELSKIVTVSFGGSAFQKTKNILKSVFVIRTESIYEYIMIHIDFDDMVETFLFLFHSFPTYEDILWLVKR